MGRGTCKAESCDKEVAGKGYCQRHYGLRRKGKLPKPRYKTCLHEGCRKRQVSGARCEEHGRAKPGAAEAPATAAS